MAAWQRIVFTLVLAAAALAPRDAGAAKWETHNNANALNTVTAFTGVVWCPSDAGLHRYNPSSGAFTRQEKTPGELPSASVSEVQIDPEGNTWFATKDRGVAVLTVAGTWRTLGAFDGLPSDSVLCLENSSLGMWVGTSAGLALFRNFQLEAAWPDGVNDSPFLSNVINDVLVLGDSTYVATRAGVFVTKSDQGILWLRRNAGIGASNVVSLAAFGSDVWCVAGDHVYRGGQTGAWTLAETGLGGALSTSLRGRGSDLLVGATNGVYRWDGASTWQLLGVGFPGSAHVEIGPAADFWAGNAEGLWVWNGSAWQLRQSAGPSGNWIQGMGMRGSTLYVASRFGGVSRFDGTSWRSFLPKGAVDPDTTFRAQDYFFSLLVEPAGDIWLGHWGQGIARLDDSTEPPSVRYYYGTEEPGYDERNTFGWASAIDPQGNRWIGLDTRQQQTIVPIGMNRIATDDTRTNFKPQDGLPMAGNQVRSITFTPGRPFEMWISYRERGVDVFFEPPALTSVPRHIGLVTDVDSLPKLPSDDCWAVEQNGDSIWIATSSGLVRWSRSLWRRSELLAVPSISTQGAIHPLSIDREGGVWLATGSGVYHRRPDRTVEVFNVDNSPLLTNDVHSVFVDRNNGDVWMGSVLGLNRYQPGESSGGQTLSNGAPFASFPNPAFLSSAGTGIRAIGLTGPFEGNVYDVQGRVVKQLFGNATSGFIWDATDANGGRARPGLYFIRILNAGILRQSRVVLIR